MCILADMAPRNPNKSQKNKTVDDSRSWQDFAIETVFGKPGYQEMGLGGAKSLIIKAAQIASRAGSKKNTLPALAKKIDKVQLSLIHI